MYLQMLYTYASVFFHCQDHTIWERISFLKNTHVKASRSDFHM